MSEMLVIWQQSGKELDLKTLLCPTAAGADRSSCKASGHRPLDPEAQFSCIYPFKNWKIMSVCFRAECVPSL